MSIQKKTFACDKTWVPLLPLAPWLRCSDSSIGKKYEKRHGQEALCEDVFVMFSAAVIVRVIFQFQTNKGINKQHVRRRRNDDV